MKIIHDDYIWCNLIGLNLDLSYKAGFRRGFQCSQVPCAARLFRYLGLEALKRLKHWAETKAWTKHQWVSDEAGELGFVFSCGIRQSFSTQVLGWVDSAFQWMQQTPAFASLEAGSAEGRWWKTTCVFDCMSLPLLLFPHMHLKSSK